MNGNDFTNEQIDTFANAMTQFIERVAEGRKKLEAEPFVFDWQEWEENKNNKSYLKQLFTAGGQLLKNTRIDNTHLCGVTMSAYSDDVIAECDNEDCLYIHRVIDGCKDAQPMFSVSYNDITETEIEYEIINNKNMLCIWLQTQCNDECTIWIEV